MGQRAKLHGRIRGRQHPFLPSAWHVLVTASPRPGCLLDPTYQPRRLGWHQLALSKALEKSCVIFLCSIRRGSPQHMGDVRTGSRNGTQAKMPRAKDLCVPSVLGGRLATPPQSKEEEKTDREGTPLPALLQHHSHLTVGGTGILCMAGRQQLSANA